MAYQNISAELTAANKTSIKNALDSIKGTLDFLINLTPKERKTLFKMGPKSVGYVQLALTVAQENPGIIPSGFDIAEFAKDVALSSGLVAIEANSAPLAEGISDTLMGVGSEAMKQANRVYDLVKVAAKNDSNMNAIKNRLAERYKGQGGSKGGSDTEPKPPIE